MSAQPSDPVAGEPAAGGDPVSADATGVPRVRSQRRIRAEHIRDYGIVVFAVALFISFSVASSVFLTSNNLLNLVYQNATTGIAACAVTLTIIAGNFDLSLGAIFVLSEVLGAYVAVHWGVWWCFPVAIGSGALMGLINGLLVTKLHVNAFLATLATALSFGGIAVGVTNGGLLITPTSSVFTFIGQHRAAGIQDPVIIFVVVAIVLQLVLAYTVFGRHLYGVGDNRNAAVLSGLKVDRIVISTFVITGAACGLAGLIDSSTTGSGSSDTSGLGGSLALLAIAGVALGGTSIFGGVGSVWRTVLGVLILGMLTNGFDLLAVQDYWQDIVRGILIILAVSISFVVDRRLPGGQFSLSPSGCAERSPPGMPSAGQPRCSPSPSAAGRNRCYRVCRQLPGPHLAKHRPVP
jgi:ribose transport system permease protein